MDVNTFHSRDKQEGEILSLNFTYPFQNIFRSSMSDPVTSESDKSLMHNTGNVLFSLWPSDHKMALI
jgi:hypothetical protein